jgi:hypothetical protein
MFERLFFNWLAIEEINWMQIGSNLNYIHLVRNEDFNNIEECFDVKEVV